MSSAFGFICLMLVLVSVGLAVLVKPSRRKGTAPTCGRCDYNLTGSESNRCPECGTLFIEAGVVFGHRSPRKTGWVLASLAVLLVLIVAGVGLMATHRAANRARSSRIRALKTMSAAAAQAQEQESSEEAEFNDDSDP